MMGQIFSRFFHVFSFLLLQNCQDEKYFAKASQVDEIPKKGTSLDKNYFLPENIGAELRV